MSLRWILLAPLFGALLNGVILRPRKASIAGGLATLFSALTFIIAVSAISGGQQVDEWFTWFSAGSIKVPFTLELTPITSLMLMVVSGIGTLIHIYATSYMAHDKAPWRFFAYLNLFLAAMLVLLLSANLVGVFLGWEGVGLCSYLLIGFWYQKDENAAAGMKAFVTNRVGDLGFLVALMIFVAYAGTTQISTLIQTLSSGNSIPAWALTAAAFGIFWAATGKSAQIPLYVWLPDAMAGPTPVSALIHAATMVTSGVFVITRLWPIFAHQPLVLDVILWGGLATAWLAALIALTQRDIKKVLAYSTVSQLGFMFVALGVGSPVAALFHVVTHACFKALLFLGAGSVIHGMHEHQDLFEMGGLRKKMKWTHITFLIGTLAIIGFPLTSGFFSKDMILDKCFERGPVAFGLLLGAALLTAFYMLRAYTLAFWGKARTEAASHAHESSPLMLGPLVVLAILSLFAGWLETPSILGDVHTLEHWVHGSWYAQIPAEHSHEVSSLTQWLLVVGISIASLAVAYLSFRKFRDFQAGKNEAVLSGPAQLSFNKFYVDEIYGFLILRPLKAVAKFATWFFDDICINGAAHGLANSVRVSGRVLSLIHTGNVQSYAWYLAFGSAAAIFVGWIFYR